MYKLTPQYQQISIFDFNQPGGLQLSSDNRWVQLADSLEWNKYEERYAEQFPSKTGRPGIPFRIAFGAYIIQKATGASDRKLCELIAEIHIISISLGSHLFSLNARSPTLLWCILERDSRLSSLWKSMK